MYSRVLLTAVYVHLNIAKLAKPVCLSAHGGVFLSVVPYSPVPARKPNSGTRRSLSEPTQGVFSDRIMLNMSITFLPLT